jgi:benzodiazapine receptor
LADIVLLAILIAATLVTFWKAQKLAALLLVPYLVWVTYASALNWALLELNSQMLG